MEDRNVNPTQTASIMLGIGTALGVSADLLLRAIPWGLNVTLWLALVILTLVLLSVRQTEAWSWQSTALALGSIFFAFCFAWRDSAMLKFIDLVAVAALLTILRMQRADVRATLSGFPQYVLSAWHLAFNNAFGGLMLLLRDIEWAEIRDDRHLHLVRSIVCGLVIAVPLLILFGGLLTSADHVFDHFVDSMVNALFGNLWSHLLLTGFFAWLVVGLLRSFLFGSVRNVPAHLKEPPLSLGLVSAGIVLGLLNVLFLMFVIVQIRNLLGGSATVESMQGFTYSEYARRGFFELVAVAALVLPLLYLMHWLFRSERPRHRHVFKVLAGIQMLLLFAIMASALMRMRLYQQEYGLTELRLYTTVFMFWLALVFVWFAVTVLREHRELFVTGVVGLALAFAFGLHVLNPDAFIVQTNAKRAEAGRDFDVYYALSLSADAIPTLLAKASSDDAQARGIAVRLLDWQSGAQADDWRSWSWGRSRAIRAIEKHRPYLEQRRADSQQSRSGHRGLTAR